jgi:hypothetical protein
MSIANPQITGSPTNPLVWNGPTWISATYTYEVRRYLPNVASSKYPGKPIFWKYKVVRNQDGTKTSTPVDNNEYWKPVEGEADYRIYSSGDEFETQEPLTSVVTIKKWLSGTGVSQKYQYGQVLDYGNKQYRCTNRTIKWKFISTKEFMGASYRDIENPYFYDDIQVWTLLPSDPNYSFTSSTGRVSVAFYWYNPKTKSFYPLPDSYGLVGLMNDKDAKSFVDFSLSLIGLRRTDKSTAMDNQFSELVNIVKNIIPPDQLNFRSSVFSALISYYAETYGVSLEAAENAVNEAYGKRKIKGTVSLSGGKGKKAANNGTSSYGGRSVAVRGSFREGYSPYDGSDASSPQIVQQYRLPGFVDPITKRHIFLLRPNQISYSNIGSEWTEIPRSGAVPLVDWKAHKLMQVSFQFIIVPDREGSLDRRPGTSDPFANEITLTVDNQIRTLNEMASAPYPVVLLGFDEMLTNEVRYPFNSGRGVEFVITDFAVSSLFRTADGAINRAQCDMTLREVPIESIAYIDFPSLKFPKNKKAPKPKKEKESESGPKLSDKSTRIIPPNIADYELDGSEVLDVRG